MRGNRRSDTKPELALRSAIHRRGLRFRKDLMLRTPSGHRVRPDIVFTRQRVAVFVDGCYWHACPDHGRSPKSNSDYWAAKFVRNRARDERNTAELEADGWLVVRLWEHVPLPEAVRTVEAVVRAEADR